MTLNQSLNIGTVITGVVVFLSIRALIKSRRKPKYKLPPGPRKLPVIGTLYAHGFTPQDLQKVGQKYGDIFSLHVASKHIVVIQSYDILLQASKMTELSDRGLARDYTGRITNPNRKGILTCDYDTAQNTRLVSMEIFRELGVGRSYMEEKILEVVQELVTSFVETNGNAFDPTKKIEFCVTKIILFVTLSITLEENDPKFLALVKAVNSVMTAGIGLFIVKQLPFSRHFPPFKAALQQFLSGSLGLTNQVSDWVDERIATFGNAQNEDFTDRYLAREGYVNDENHDLSDREEIQDSFDREQLVYLLKDLLIAGSDTSITSLRWALLYLANRQQIQDKVRTEIHDVVGKDATVQMKDKVNLHYLQAVISEILRFSSSAGLSVPHQAHEDVEMCGFDIPKSSMVLFNLYAIHRDPRLWDEPNSFKPERFIDEIGHFQTKPYLVPFMKGKRSCLGEILARQELFLFTANIVRCFKISPPDGVDVLNEEGIWGMMYRPKHFDVRFIHV